MADPLSIAIGCVILWVTCGVASWPLAVGWWQNNKWLKDEIPIALLATGFFLGPVGSLIIFGCWGIDGRDRLRVGWLYGVRNGETCPIGKWWPALNFTMLICIACVLASTLISHRQWWSSYLNLANLGYWVAAIPRSRHRMKKWREAQVPFVSGPTLQPNLSSLAQMQAQQQAAQANALQQMNGLTGPVYYNNGSPSFYTMPDGSVISAPDHATAYSWWVQTRQSGLHQITTSSTVFYQPGQYQTVSVRPEWLDGLLMLVGQLPNLRDPAYDDTMGFRSWDVDLAQGVLVSPQQHTPWHDAELHCEQWSENDVVRGVAGIHAHFVPIGWRGNASNDGQGVVTGIVERFGKYALGTEGWRAEWVIIRKLVAQNRYMAAGLREMYPDVEVVMKEPA